MNKRDILMEYTPNVDKDDIVSSQMVNIYADERFSWMWTDNSTIPAWRFTTPNVNKTTRRQRIYSNAVDAYFSMLMSQYGISHVKVQSYGINGVSLDYDRREWGHDEAFGARESMKNHVYTMYTPFFSSPCMDWYANPQQIADNHLYVDASICMDGPEGLPVSCYATYSPISGLQVNNLTANSSVDAEYQGIQNALRKGYLMARESGERVTIFADCTPAITRTLFLDTAGTAPYLGREVFIQWLPGHRGYEGMNIVDRAARERVRELMSQN